MSTHRCPLPDLALAASSHRATTITAPP